MRFFFSFVLSILILSSSALSQLLVKDKSNTASDGRSQVSIYPGELTSLSGIPNGPVFVAGYATEIGRDYIKARPLLWKIANSAVTLKELRSPYRIDGCLWFDEQTGWGYALGGGIYKTIDGGSNWVKEPYFGSREFFFLDKNHGWYFGDNGQLLKNERGKTVKLFRFGDFPYVKKLQFVNVEIGWLLDVVDGQSRFQKSIDGGKSWKITDTPFTDVYHFQFLNDTDGFVSSPEGVYGTIDGGRSWELMLEAEENEGIDNVFFLSLNAGWSLSNNRICMTMNGGHVWKCEERPKELDGNINGFIFTNESNGWLLVDDRLYFTSDGGKSWKRKILSFGKIQF